MSRNSHIVPWYGCFTVDKWIENKSCSWKGSKTMMITCLRLKNYYKMIKLLIHHRNIDNVAIEMYKAKMIYLLHLWKKSLNIRGLPTRKGDIHLPGIMSITFIQEKIPFKVLDLLYGTICSQKNLKTVLPV